MKGMPSSLKIGAVTYRVTNDPDEWMRNENQQQRKGAYGYTGNVEATIWLNPALAPTVQPITLLHEAMHALAETTMGSLDWRGLGKTPADREEAVIRAWESPLMCLLRDNPDLVAYLTSDQA